MLNDLKVEKAIEALRRPAPALEGVASVVRQELANIIEAQRSEIERLSVNSKRR